MKHLLVPVFGLIGILVSCNNPGSQQSPIAASQEKNNSSQTTASDSLALTTLIRQLYQWRESNPAPEPDFSPKKAQPTDTSYSGIDWTAHNAAAKRLEKTGFFNRAFLDNYQHIAQYIDSILKNKVAVWPEGELPPFGNDADPWCNCQDVPEGHTWGTIKLTNLQLGKNEASFQWILSDDYKYTVKAQKEKGSWTISYLEGFNFNNYTLQE